MIRIGDISHFKRAKKLLTDAGFTIKLEANDFVQKLIIDGEEAISIARTSVKASTWVYRYNPKYWGEDNGGKEIPTHISH